jgi:hypothetical protein
LQSSTILQVVYFRLLNAFIKESQRFPEVLVYRPFQILYQTILSSFISKESAPQPRPPRNWVRRWRGCGCEECNILDVFLRNPSLSQTEIRQYVPVLDHIEERLRRDIRDETIKTEIIRGSQPLTLRIQKVDHVYECELKVWTQKQDFIKKKIPDLGVQSLRMLLGEHFQTIMDVRPIVPSPTLASPSDLFAPGSRTLNITGEPAPASPEHRTSNSSGPASYGIVDLTANFDDETPNTRSTAASAMPPPNASRFSGLANSSATNVSLPPILTASGSTESSRDNIHDEATALPPMAGLVTNAAQSLPPISSILAPHPTSSGPPSSSAVLPLGPADGNVMNRPHPPPRRDISKISGEDDENAANNVAKRLKIETASHNGSSVSSITSPQSSTAAGPSSRSIADAVALAAAGTQEDSRSASRTTVPDTYQVA